MRDRKAELDKILDDLQLIGEYANEKRQSIAEALNTSRRAFKKAEESERLTMPDGTPITDRRTDKQKAESQRNYAYAMANYEDAKINYSEQLQNLKSDILTRVADLQNRYNKIVYERYKVQPSDLDKDVIALLNTNIFSGEELTEFARDFANNPTMIRIIYRNSEINGYSSAELKEMFDDIANGTERENKAFDSIADIIRRTTSENDEIAKGALIMSKSEHLSRYIEQAKTEVHEVATNE